MTQMLGFNANSSRNIAQLPNVRPACQRLGALHICGAAKSSPKSSSGEFSSASGKGKVGVASSAPPPSGTSSSMGSTPNRTTPRPLASSQTIKEAQSMAKLFLQSELSTIFDTGRLNVDKYSRDFTFQDPVTRYSGIQTFQNALRALTAIFKINFTVHSTVVTGDTEITTRWTIELTPRLLPQQPLVFTGESIYLIDVLTGGKILSQRDTWDGVQDNSFLSVEGVAFLLGQLATRRLSPRLDGPTYTVLKKTKDYEIRQYRAYLAAEIGMSSSSRPAGSEGFNNLASYIFGENNLGTQMDMTTPVFTTAGQGGSSKMEFPIDEKLIDDPNQLPIPSDTRIKRTREDAKVVAAGDFGGFPLDFEVTDAERRLRGALVLDGLKAVDGYKLARYNDPFTPPFLRRNEVLIKLEDYQLEQPEPISQD